LAYSRKLTQLRRGVVTKSSIWDVLVFKKAQVLIYSFWLDCSYNKPFKAEFGGNVKLILTGSAPISAEVSILSNIPSIIWIF